MKKREGLYDLYLQGIEKVVVTAKIKDFSTTVSKKGVIIPTMLLVNICDAETGRQLAEHSWVVVRYNTGDKFAKGKTIKFLANVQHYNGSKVGIGYLKKVIV